jgi:hypothetical protein
MKRNAALVLMMTAFLFQTTIVSAVTTASPSATLSPTKTATSSATTTPSAEDKQIETIKKNIANTVQEIQKKGHKAAAGYITSIKDTQVVIKDSLDKTTNVKLDPQLTQVFQISGSTKKDIKQSDLAKNMYIIVSGPLLDNTINANVVYVDEEYFVKSGKIVEVNTTDDSLKISTTERDTVTVDIDSRLKVQIMDSKTLELSTITSFTKIKEGDTVHFIYAKTGKETTPNRFDALKVVVIPQEYFIQK